MNRRLTRKHVVTAIMSVAAGSVAWACGCPAVIDSVWQAGMNAASTTVQAGITGLVEAVSASETLNLMRIQSALKVVAKQMNASGEKMTASDVGAKQAQAVWLVKLANRKAVLETAMEYNAATGQGFDPCGETARSRKVAVAIGEANTDMQEKVLREVDASPGRYVPSQAGVIAQRLSDAKGKYCSQGDKDAGVCGSVGALAGKDVSAAHFFSTTTVGTPENDAKSAMLNYLYGAPRQAPDKATVTSPAATAYFEARRTEDALRSVSQASLKTIQSWTESRGGNQSVLDAIAEKVGSYAGGANYGAWELKKTAESEHGLLVDLAKMRAFELYMRNLEYQQTERMEAVVAAMLATRARGLGNDNNLAQASARTKVQ